MSEVLDFAAIERYRCKSDGLITRTSSEQEDCESSCSLFFFPLPELPLDQQLELQQLNFVNTDLEPLLMREKHVAYLKRGLTRLSAGFVTLDASRPWIIYWILHALELLDALPDEMTERVIGTLKPCWNDDHDGGFGGGPKQLGHTATNYASCLTLALLGTLDALESVDRLSLYRFFMSRKHAATGAFMAHDGGEVDVRVTYCVISIASLYGILTDELKAGVVDYILSCQTYEGGFGGEPGNEAHGGYAFCSVATLYILEAVDQIRDFSGLLHWLANRQMPFEGGYQGRTNKLVDGCYSFWQGAIPALLASEVRRRFGDIVPYQCHREQLQRYILLCGQEISGGLRDKPGKPRDHYHTCYCLSGLSVAQYGDGRGSPVVFGDASNLVARTHPAYNISYDKVIKAIEYFKSKGSFQPSNFR
ncbi:farnesyltransferase beta subunit [Plasmopara halstedii]|uniref:Protein farnesyltransferase subunit beta n=1 Tax=Plasmopara halstedii TaxID=4781 RepID=A0A0N7L712_PLAHL|nr:farnesyltransferase beta subunit [Plasmopara halstedii]CEG45787.1 farnesyltransferase beta subunit [Plasmopara halstedii]|eukprot:XP_024582156.1 farnesyltransferase beta subunit [Plasmopara halstedii]